MSGIIEAVGNLFNGPPPAPPAPDYTGAATATAQGNLQAAQAATAANRVNQYTPYGSLVYSQAGTDSQGNPMWNATTNLSPVGQQLLDTQNATSLGLGGAINSQLNQVNQTMGQGFNPNTGPITTNAGQANLSMVGQGPQMQTKLGGTGMQGWQQATNDVLQTLAPQLEHQSEMSDAQLANQGIMPGSEAYKNAKTQLGINQNNLLAQASLAGQNVQQNLFGQNLAAGQFGNAAQQQQYTNALAQQQANNAAAQQGFANNVTNANLGNAAQQQQYNQALTNYNLPLNTLSALRTGAQVQNPTFQNVPQQATTAGADILGATTAAGNYNLGTYNAQQAANAGVTGGLFGLGGAALMSPTGTFGGSDIRMKENIKEIGFMANGLPVYEFEYKPEFKDKKYNGHGKFIGVMAHEVEKLMPEAVITNEDGYKMVNYGVLNG